jgi:hypothetical protein
VRQWRDDFPWNMGEMRKIKDKTIKGKRREEKQKPRGREIRERNTGNWNKYRSG